MLAGCTPATICGSHYETYGVLTQERAIPKIKYEISPAGVILSIIFFESVIIPVYIIGFDIMDPVGIYTKDGGFIRNPSTTECMDFRNGK